jgi:hypothetical protein
MPVKLTQNALGNTSRRLQGAVSLVQHLVCQHGPPQHAVVIGRQLQSLPDFFFRAHAVSEAPGKISQVCTKNTVARILRELGGSDVDASAIVGLGIMRVPQAAA